MLTTFLPAISFPKLFSPLFKPPSLFVPLPQEKDVTAENREIRRLSLVCFFFFFTCHTYSMWTFLGQGFNLSHSCDLCHSCGNAGSFNPLHQAGDRTQAYAAARVTAVGFLTHCTTLGTPVPGFLVLKIQSLRESEGHHTLGAPQL